MSKTYIIHNPLAGNKKSGLSRLEQLKLYLKNKNPICIDATTIQSYSEFFSELSKDDAVYLCGGDGTINYMVNELGDKQPPCNIFYYSAGTGNDFLKDIEKQPDDEPFCINKYITDLPIVTVNNKSYRFLNNVGYGLDGYCSETGDKQKQSSNKPVNYTAIALKGLLFYYQPRNAKITVDGITYAYNKVWLAVTMKGRFYGGGMMAVPSQDRLDKERKVSVMLIHNSSRLHTLCMFPQIFNGEHVKNKDIISIHSGHNIIVEFDTPAPLQIDGETIHSVKKYQVCAK